MKLTEKIRRYLGTAFQTAYATKKMGHFCVRLIRLLSKLVQFFVIHKS